MLNGAAVMDAALLLVAANEPCPQPQTSEHLAAVEIMKLKHIIILQNKIDLVKRAAAIEQQQQIQEFVKGAVGWFERCGIGRLTWHVAQALLPRARRLCRSARSCDTTSMWLWST